MPHVFVESNWLFAFAAPAHHQVPAAAELLDRAQHGEFILHMPNLCIGEAREAIMAKCQPRKEANAIRRFLSWSEPAGGVTKADAEVTRAILDKYENSVRQNLNDLDGTLRPPSGPAVSQHLRLSMMRCLTLPQHSLWTALPRNCSITRSWRAS